MFKTLSVGCMGKALLSSLVYTTFVVALSAQQAPKVAPAAKSATTAAKPARTANAAGTGTQKLPLRRVVLYKSGVGYFEHDGQVRGNESVEINLTSSQLDDVLKSLTALDLSGGRIVGASYNSAEPTGRQLQELPVPVANRTTLTSLLEGLRGARLEARTSAGAFTGQLLGVEQHTRREAGVEADVQDISLLTDGGDVRSFPLDPSTTLRFADRELEQELVHALGLLNSSYQEDTRHLLLTTAGTGARDLRVSYNSEVPVWKTTYRIILPGPGSPAGTRPLLQGWAVVDNTVGEDWNDVELSLAAGAPPIVYPAALTNPTICSGPSCQCRETSHASAPDLTAEALAHRQFERAKSSFSNCHRHRLAPTRFRRQGAGSGGGTGSGAFRPQAQLGGAISDGSDFFAAATSINAAQANQLGDLFEYKLTDHVTIHKNESAIVPIIQTEIAVEKVALWNAGLPTPHPLSALWVTNTSPLVLDGGSFNVVDGGAFGGEGLIDSMEPAEKRLISYAADLGLQVVAKQDGTPGAGSTVVTRIQIAHGTMIRTTESHTSVTYTIRNEDISARTLVLEHPVRNGWKLVADLKPQEQTATAYRFRIDISPKQTKTFTVDETRPTTTQYQLTNLNPKQIEAFATNHELTPEIEMTLRQILAQKDTIAKLTADFKVKQENVNQIFQDQERLRENMKALKGTPEEKSLAERYTSELNDQETQLSAVRKEMGSIQAQQMEAQQQLDATIEMLLFDAKI